MARRPTDPAEVRNRIDDSDLAATRDALHDELLDWMHANRDPFRSPAWERRPWRSARRLRFEGGWSGRRRGRDDGYAAPFTQENYALLDRETPADTPATEPPTGR